VLLLTGELLVLNAVTNTPGMVTALATGGTQGLVLEFDEVRRPLLKTSVYARDPCRGCLNGENAGLDVLLMATKGLRLKLRS